MKTKITVLNTFYYILGFLTVGFGVNIMDKSELGLGAWDTVTFNIYDFMIDIVGLDPDKFLIGYVSGVISIIIMLAVLLYRKKAKYLIMLIPVFLMANAINFWYYLVFESIVVEALGIKVLFFIIGLFVLPLGLSLVIKSSYPAFVFDEWTFMLSEILHIKNFAITRIIIEVIGVTIGVIFGYLTYLGTTNPDYLMFGSVGLGTVIIVFSIGPTIQFYLKLFKVEKEEKANG